MSEIEEKPLFQRVEKRLQGLVDQLETRLRRTDQATVEAREIREELKKLKRNQ